MPELLTPGVYMQEVEFGPQPIEGVSTSTAGFVGEAERGPTEGPPTLVTSFPDFQRKFGGFVKDKRLAYAIKGFFENGGKRAYVSRVAVTDSTTPADNAAKASKMLAATGHCVAIRTATPGGNSLTLASVVGLGIGTGALTLVKRAGGVETTYDTTRVNSATGAVTLGSTNLPSAFDPEDYYARIVPAPTLANVLKLEARDLGAFGKRLGAFVEAHYANRTTVTARISDGSDSVVALSDTGFLKVGAQVEVEVVNKKSGSNDEYKRQLVKVTAINPATRQVTVTPALPTPSSGFAFDSGTLYLVAWRVSTTLDGAVVETLEGITSVVEGSYAPAFAAELEVRSSWLRAPSFGSPTAYPPRLCIFSGVSRFPTMPSAEAVLLEGGEDGKPADANAVIGRDMPPRRGLKALEAQDGISIIAAPGFTSKIVVDELVGQAERRMDRFAVFESTNAPDVTTTLNERGQYNSKFAAMYHPWIKVSDPLTGAVIDMPPSGHIVGAYARIDNQRGVFKAPANTGITGATGLSFDVTDGEQDVLNPAGVNCLRFFSGLGNVIWGARTVSAEGLWKYVPVRRLFIFLEQSIIKGTRYAVFEPNDLRLWARLRDSVTNFLTTQWRAGALFGSKPEEAFFVRVDETTTTQDDRDNGRVNIVVGIAPVKPAEFVVFQIGQAPQSVIIAEQG